MTWFSFHPADMQAPCNQCWHAHVRQGCFSMPMCMRFVLSLPGTPRPKKTHGESCHACAAHESVARTDEDVGEHRKRGTRRQSKHRHDAKLSVHPQLWTQCWKTSRPRASCGNRSRTPLWTVAKARAQMHGPSIHMTQMHEHAIVYTHGTPCISTVLLLCWGSGKKTIHLARSLLAPSIVPMARLALLGRLGAMGRGRGLRLRDHCHHGIA